MAYPKHIRDEKLAEYRRLVDGGTTVLDAAAAVGLPYFTLRRWALAERGMVPAADVRARAKRRGFGTLVLTFSNGYRVEGARLEDAIEVLRAIGG